MGLLAKGDGLDCTGGWGDGTTQTIAWIGGTRVKACC